MYIKNLTRLIAILIFCNISAKLVSQNNIIISGTLSGYSSTVYFVHNSGLTPLELENNKFKIEIESANLPTNISFANIHKSNIKYLSPKIWIDSDSVNVVINCNTDKKDYQISEKYKYQDISESIEFAKNKKEQIELIKKNIDIYPALFFLYDLRNKFGIEDIETALKLVPNTYKSILLYERTSDYVKATKLPTPKKGKKFDSFSLELPSGEMLTVENSAKKYRLFAFVTSGCYFSLASLKELAKLHDKYNNKLEIITIWDDEDKNMWLNYKSDLKEVIKWTNLWDKTKFVNQYFDISTYPSFYLIDKNGKIVDIVRGLQMKKINKMLNKL